MAGRILPSRPRRRPTRHDPVSPIEREADREGLVPTAPATHATTTPAWTSVPSHHAAPRARSRWRCHPSRCPLAPTTGCRFRHSRVGRRRLRHPCIRGATAFVRAKPADDDVRLMKGAGTCAVGHVVGRRASAALRSDMRTGCASHVERETVPGLWHRRLPPAKVLICSHTLRYGAVAREATPLVR
jgi:hypothetical protein